MASVSLCMIVRDEEANLAPCLQPLRDLVAEVVLVDTGSHDRTRAAAERLGARVFDFPWNEDFAAARNESLRHAQTDWIFWMDADDRLEAPHHDLLRSLFAQLHQQKNAYAMTTVSRQADTLQQLRHIRLFRNLPEIRWRGSVHEQILPALEQAQHQILPSPVVITHTGYADVTLNRRKLERNCRLLENARAAGTAEPYQLYYLALTWNDLGRHQEALQAVHEFLARAHPADPLRAPAAWQHIRALLATGQKIAAAAQLPQYRRQFPDEATLCFAETRLAFERKDLPTEEKLLRELLNPQHSWNCSEPGLTGFKSRQNLALVLAKQGKLEESQSLLQSVLAEKPELETAWAALAQIHLLRRRWDDAQQAIDQLARSPAGAPLAASLRQTLAAARIQK